MCAAERSVFVFFLIQKHRSGTELHKAYLPAGGDQLNISSRSPQRPAGEQNYGQWLDFLRLTGVSGRKWQKRQRELP